MLCLIWSEWQLECVKNPTGWHTDIQQNDPTVLPSSALFEVIVYYCWTFLFDSVAAAGRRLIVLLKSLQVSSTGMG